MKYVSLFLVLVWLGALIGLFFGYEPSKITIGCAFFLCSLQQLGQFLDSKVSR